MMDLGKGKGWVDGEICRNILDGWMEWDGNTLF